MYGADSDSGDSATAQLAPPPTGAGDTTTNTTVRNNKPPTTTTTTRRRRQCGEQMFAQSIHDTLEQTGELATLRATMRATILSVIRNGDRSSINRVSNVYRTPAVDLVHSLILDYLQWSGFHYAAEMFTTESGVTPLAGTGGNGSGGADAPGSGSGTAGNVRRRMDLAGQVAGGSADGGCRLAESVVDVPVLLAMVVQGMRLEDDEQKPIGSKTVLG